MGDARLKRKRERGRESKERFVTKKYERKNENGCHFERCFNSDICVSGAKEENIFYFS